MVRLYFNRECYNYLSDWNPEDSEMVKGLFKDCLENYIILLNDYFNGVEHYFCENPEKIDLKSDERIDLVSRIGKGLKFLEGEDVILEFNGEGPDGFIENLKKVVNGTCFGIYFYEPEHFFYDAIKFCQFDCRREFLRGRNLVRLKKSNK